MIGDGVFAISQAVVLGEIEKIDGFSAYAVNAFDDKFAFCFWRLDDDNIASFEVAD